MTDNTVQILFVEDNKADARLVQELFQSENYKFNIVTASDGDEALNILGKADGDAPDLIFLDLNLPKTSGREVLTTIKSDPKLKSIPVIVLSTSSSKKDIAESYALGANAFVSKPVGLDRVEETLRNVAQFWLSTALLNGTFSPIH